ncbi:MAG TPA: ribosome biogenesis GTPase YlqF [Halanaerobiaceae bacterium]|jgi:ribosome biogenesis GTPase A|nr:ribosome biogenesis GTPase YlqF [Bacillota bacterium]HHU93281.1 ribosome biogenesis GTPase YlqF [Halanaerobiaceae bacterium]HOA40290.1 ribosome biogenesis GTPase YlqF [Halanaerobiales bacterium]HPZ62342.1 ribosome biogenesis GTPase YlqF [Halanaerobiales bacterium]HQD03182.1 ribosome biogenesis GTPase YlqF [Halanaerobiales bacterium]
MIQWYPGHMAKTKRILEEDLKLVDLVVEVLDARIPLSSQNPDLTELLGKKKRIIVLNKMDLANTLISAQWKNYFARDYPVVLLNSLTGQGMKDLLAIIEGEGREINKLLQEKGRNKRAVRIMVAGIPNVGKSALINMLAGTKTSKTGNKPGVTRGRQWIVVREDIQLLDTPGILWPKFDDEDVGFRLALTGAIRDEVFDEEEAACKLIEYIIQIDKGILEKAYNIEIDEEIEIAYDILANIGRKSGCLMSGGRVDRSRAASRLINDFRKGKLGSISLEVPGDDS